MRKWIKEKLKWEHIYWLDKHIPKIFSCICAIIIIAIIWQIVTVKVSFNVVQTPYDPSIVQRSHQLQIDEQNKTICINARSALYNMKIIGEIKHIESVAVYVTEQITCFSCHGDILGELARPWCHECHGIVRK